MSPPVCRFSAAGNDDLTSRSDDRRLKSAKARNRVVCRFSAAGNDDLTSRSDDRRLKSAKARNRVGR
jgi:hypothetical protein